MSHTYPPATPAGDGRVPCLRTATVETGPEPLAIRTAPSAAAPCAGYAPDGARLTVHGRCGGWFAARCGRTEGFVPGSCIVLHY